MSYVIILNSAVYPRVGVVIVSVLCTGYWVLTLVWIVVYLSTWCVYRC